MEDNCHNYGIRYIIATGSENIPYGMNIYALHEHMTTYWDYVL